MWSYSNPPIIAVVTLLCSEAPYSGATQPELLQHDPGENGREGGDRGGKQGRQTACCLSRAEFKDTIHPAYHLFALLPSSRHYGSNRTRIHRLGDCFIQQAITTLD
ncbi:unnamed protein product [Menidia menidia]|uniref:(Atlantic silverside) hypothetical protein n=1 Tax=Menidia menidia TaxID=238744 RepID=A0A8S4BL65_9TELE|nr:unnamed protein product [Menidia menidia]